MVRLKQPPVIVISPGGGELLFSSVIDSGKAFQPAHLVESYPTHYLVSWGYHTVLGQDLCVVMWRGGGTGPAMGQNVVAVEEGQEEVGEFKEEDGVFKEIELAPVYSVLVRVLVQPGLGEERVLMEK